MLQNNQIPQALESLKKSKFRSKFKLTEKDRQYIQDKGIDTIRQHAVDFIKARIVSQYPKNDGKQTPMRGHPVFHCSACHRNLLQGLYSEMAWDKEGKGAFRSGNTVSC